MVVVEEENGVVGPAADQIVVSPDADNTDTMKETKSKEVSNDATSNEIQHGENVETDQKEGNPNHTSTSTTKEEENDDEDDDNYFVMKVESTGKFTRKANWDDLNRFTGKDITSDILRDMIVKYQESCFPEGT